MNDNQRSWLQAVSDGLSAIFGNWNWPYAPLVRGVLFVLFAALLFIMGTCVAAGCTAISHNVGDVEVISQGEDLQDALHEAYVAAGGGLDDPVFDQEMVDWYLLYAGELANRLIEYDGLTALDLLKTARIQEGIAAVRAAYDSPAYVRQRCLSLAALAASLGNYDVEEGLDSAAAVVEAAVGVESSELGEQVPDDEEGAE